MHCKIGSPVLPLSCSYDTVNDLRIAFESK